MGRADRLLHGRIGAVPALQHEGCGRDQRRLGGEKVQARVGDALKDNHGRYMKVAREKNKAWQQADRRMKVYVLPKLGNRKIKDIGRQDIWRLSDELSDRKVLGHHNAH